MVIYVIIL